MRFRLLAEKFKVQFDGLDLLPKHNFPIRNLLIVRPFFVGPLIEVMPLFLRMNVNARARIFEFLLEGRGFLPCAFPFDEYGALFN